MRPRRARQASSTARAMRSCWSRKCSRTRPTGRNSDRCGSSPARPIATSSSGASRLIEPQRGGGEMKPIFRIFCAALLLAAPIEAHAAAPAQVEGQRWSAAQAKIWYAKQPWLTGANFIPADAINELEMWQAATFDPVEIDRELGWADREYAMNTMRVFLHDLAWKQDPEGFKRRIDAFLAIAARHHIRPVFVLFDSCWDPDP